MLLTSFVMMLRPLVASDVMFAHCAEGTTSLPKATSLGEADIICPQGQTSFGAPALSQVAVSPPLPLVLDFEIKTVPQKQIFGIA